MPLNHKLAASGLLLLNGYWGCSTASFFSCWMSMELSLILFIPLCALGASGAGVLLSVKYLLVQSIAGLLIIPGLTGATTTGPNSVMGLLLTVLVLFKLGGFPFVQWVLLVGSKLEWATLYVMLTLQKLIPLLLLSQAYGPEVGGAALLSWALLPVMGGLSSSVKKIVILSSVFNLMMILSVLGASVSKWKGLLFLYFIMAGPLILLGGLMESGYGAAKAHLPKLKAATVVFVFFMMMGMPPFPGFIFKLDVLLHMLSHGYGLSAMFACGGSAAMVVLYLGVALTSLLTTPGVSSAPLMAEKPLVLVGVSLAALGLVI